MKIRFSYILLMLLATGCITNHKEEYDPEMKLLFHPVMHVQTKTQYSIEHYPEGQPFAVNVWTLDKEQCWRHNAEDADIYISGEYAYMSDADRWALMDDHLWPEREKKVTVIGYSPVRSFSSCTSVYGASCTYDMRESQEDLLYTDPQTDLDKVECGGTVVMPFYHALSQVDFEVKNRVRDDEEIFIKSIWIDGVKCCGSFKSLPTPTWELEDDEMQLLFFEGNQPTGNNPIEIGTAWNVIPQTLSTKVTVEYEYRTSANTGFTLRLKTCDLQTNLKPGRHYTYTLAVGIDEVQFLLEIIEDKFKAQAVPEEQSDEETIQE